MDMKSTQKMHTIEHSLAEAKVHVTKDFSFEVAGMKIEGREGDVNNVPRWVGRIIEDSGLGTLESADMVTELKQAYTKEQMMGQYELSTLDPLFYIKLHEAMEKIEGTDLERVEGLLEQLFRTRRGKIVRLADASQLTADTRSKMSVEERVFYETIHASSAEFERQVRGK